MVLGRRREMEKKMAQRIDVLLMNLAQSISNLVSKIQIWICVRLDYYVEIKEFEISKHNHSFPKEWFEKEE